MLDLCPPFLPVDSLALRRCRWFCGPPSFRYVRCLFDPGREFLEAVLDVATLLAIFRRKDDHLAFPVDATTLQPLQSLPNGPPNPVCLVDVKSELDSCRDLVNVLSAGSSRSGEAQSQAIDGYFGGFHGEQYSVSSGRGVPKALPCLLVCARVL